MLREIDLVAVSSPQVIPQQVPPRSSGRLVNTPPTLLEMLHRQVVSGRKLPNGTSFIPRERFEISLQERREQHRVRQGMLFCYCLVSKVPSMRLQSCLDQRLSRLDDLPILSKQDREGFRQLKVGKHAQLVSRAGEP